MSQTSALSEYGLRADQELFVYSYVRDGSIENAARKTGRREETVRKWLKDPKVNQAIQNEAKQRLNNGAIAAINILRDVMENTEDDKLRIQAAKDLLDRAGWKPEMLHTTADRRLENQSIKEMSERINELCSDLGVQAPKIVDVTPKAAPAPPTPDSPDPLGEANAQDQDTQTEPKSSISQQNKKRLTSNPPQDTSPEPGRVPSNPSDDTDIMSFLDEIDLEVDHDQL